MIKTLPEPLSVIGLLCRPNVCFGRIGCVAIGEVAGQGGIEALLEALLEEIFSAPTRLKSLSVPHQVTIRSL